MKFLIKSNVDEFIVNDSTVREQSDIRHWMINHLDMSIEYETEILSDKKYEIWSEINELEDRLIQLKNKYNNEEN